MDSRKMGQYTRKHQPKPHGTCKSPPPPFEAPLIRAKMHYQQYRNIPPSSSLSLDDLPSKLRPRESSYSNNPFIKDDDDLEVQSHSTGTVNNDPAVSTEKGGNETHEKAHNLGRKFEFSSSTSLTIWMTSLQKLSDDGGVGPEALENMDSSSESKSSTQKSPDDVGWGSQIPAVEDGGVKVKRVSFQNSVSKKDIMKARAEAKLTEALSKLRREEELIDAWKNEQEAKAETQKKRIEKRLDKLRAKEIQKIQKKMDEVYKKAEEKKAAERAKFEAEAAASSMKTAYGKLLSAKKLPWSLF